LVRHLGKADETLIGAVDAMTARVRIFNLNNGEGDPVCHAAEARLPSDENSNVSAAASLSSGGSPSVRNAARILTCLRPFRGSIVLLLGLSLGAVAIDIVPPLLQRSLVDHVLAVDPPKNLREHLLFYLGTIVAGLLLVRVAATLVAIWKSIVASRVGTSMTANLRNELVEKLNALPMAFHDRNQVGKLMSHVAYDTEALHTLVFHLTSGFLLQSFQLLGIGVMLFFLNAKLALITMLPMPLIVVGSWYFTRRLQPRHRHYWEAVGRQASALMGMLSGIRVVKAFAQEDRETARFRISSGRLRDSRMVVESATAVFSASMGLLFAFGTLAVWFIGGSDVMAGTMSLGSLMAFLMYLAMFYTPLTTIVESTTWFANFLSISRRVGELLESPSESTVASQAASPDRPSVSVEFEDVSFGYEKERPVLKHVDLAIAPGEMIGVAGRSGSGKSTLVSLIARLYEVDSGRVLLGGVDVRDMNPREFRRRIGMVPQDPFLFRGSVVENIAYGNANAAPERILAAARRADAHDFIMRLPFAYESQLGEGGTGLSGGERQRLSIARALVGDPEILILDEATASVDAESERAICASLRRGGESQTIIVIAHRLSTLRNVDRLAVFDNGRLVEQGAPQELLERDGVYAALAGTRGNRRAAPGRPRGDSAAPPLFSPKNGKAASGGFADSEISRDGRTSGRVPDQECGSLFDWLDPAASIVEIDSHGALCAHVRGKRYRDVYAVRCFPGSHKSRFIVLLRGSASGRVRELGMIQSLDDWPQDAQRAIEKSLGRRHMFRLVHEIHRMRVRGNQLVMSATIDAGSIEVPLKKSGEGSQRLAGEGLLLCDETGNYYAVPDRRKLPRQQRTLLETYVGE
jgi:ATP-binding cassette subfamily B protein